MDVVINGRLVILSPGGMALILGQGGLKSIFRPVLRA